MMWLCGSMTQPVGGRGSFRWPDQPTGRDPSIALIDPLSNKEMIHEAWTSIWSLSHWTVPVPLGKRTVRFVNCLTWNRWYFSFYLIPFVASLLFLTVREDSNNWFVYRIFSIQYFSNWHWPVIYDFPWRVIIRRLETPNIACIQILRLCIPTVI